MKLRTTLYSFAAVLLLGSIFLAGCTTEDQPGTTGDGITRIGSNTTDSRMTVTGLSDGQRYVFAVKGNTGTGTMIKGLSSNGSGSIVVVWTRGATDVGVDSIFYKKVDAATTSLTVDGTVYTAQTWATASMFGPITIYEDGLDDGTAGHLSGITITSAGVSSVSTRFGADVHNYDFKLRTDNTQTAPFLVLEPGVRNDINDIRKAEMISSVGIGVINGGASADYYSSGFLTQGTFSQNNSWVVPAVDAGGVPFLVGDAAMIPIKTIQADGTTHYGRIEVLSSTGNPNGVNAFWHEAAQRSITVNVYYQTVADLDYARSHDAGNSGH